MRVERESGSEIESDGENESESGSESESESSKKSQKFSAYGTRVFTPVIIVSCQAHPPRYETDTHESCILLSFKFQLRLLRLRALRDGSAKTPQCTQGSFDSLCATKAKADCTTQCDCYLTRPHPWHSWQTFASAR